MSTRNKVYSRKLLFDFMSAFDDDDMPDGAWQAMLTDAVRQYNEEFGTNFDEHDMFLAYYEKTRGVHKS